MAALASGPYADSGVALADLCLHYSCYEYSLIYTHNMFPHPLCFRKPRGIILTGADHDLVIALTFPTLQVFNK